MSITHIIDTNGNRKSKRFSFEPNLNFLDFRSEILAKAFRKIRRARKTSQIASGRQRSLPLAQVAKSRARASGDAPTRSVRHSKGGERG